MTNEQTWVHRRGDGRRAPLAGWDVGHRRADRTGTGSVNPTEVERRIVHPKDYIGRTIVTMIRRIEHGNRKKVVFRDVTAVARMNASQSTCPVGRRTAQHMGYRMICVT